MRAWREWPCWRPMSAEVALGLVWVLPFGLSGRGFGASGARTRVAVTLQHWVAPSMTEQSTYFARHFEGAAHPLNHDLVSMLAGILLGAMTGAIVGGQFRFEVLRRPWIPRGHRLLPALFPATAFVPKTGPEYDIVPKAPPRVQNL